MDYLFDVFVLLGFLAVFLLLEGAYMAWNAYQGPAVKRVTQRLRVMSAGANNAKSSLLKQRLLAQSPGIERFLLQIPRIHQLDKLILQAGLQLSVAVFIGMIVLCALLAGLLAMFFALPMWLSVLIGLVGGTLPILYMVNAKRNRLDWIERQLPDALDLMARAMKSGHAFPSALQMVGSEMPHPIAAEFQIVFDEINYGVSVQDALTNLLTRVPSIDLRYFVIAVLIQRETGGNLAELLDNISGLIRARLKLLGTVQVLSAEGRLSAWILTLLPFALALMLQLINPKFLSLLWTDPMGLKMVGIAGCMMVIGIFSMWRIIKIRV